MKNTGQKTATIASNSDSLVKSEVCNQSLVFSFIDTRQKTATIASNSDSLAKNEVCNQSLVFIFIDEKP